MLRGAGITSYTQSHFFIGKRVWFEYLESASKLRARPGGAFVASLLPNVFVVFLCLAKRPRLECLKAGCKREALLPSGGKMGPERERARSAHTTGQKSIGKEMDVVNVKVQRNNPDLKAKCALLNNLWKKFFFQFDFVVTGWERTSFCKY